MNGLEGFASARLAADDRHAGLWKDTFDECWWDGNRLGT
jgi:hypothetical protein